MKAIIYSITALLILLVAGCNPKEKKEQNTARESTELKGQIMISGADALFPLMKIWAEEFTKDKADLKINVINGGTGKGIKDLVSGNCDLAMVSRELEPDEESQGLVCFRITKEGVVPIINENNPYREIILKKGMSRQLLIDLFTKNKYQSWGAFLNTENNDSVKIFTRSDLSGAASIWSKYLGKKQEDLKGFPVRGDENIIHAVVNDPLSISYCNAHYAFDIPGNKTTAGIIAVPIDVNDNGTADKKENFNNNICKLQRAVYLGMYPSCLCRYLYVVTKDRPTNPIVIEFLKWIYEEGQTIAEKSGYARLRGCEAEEFIKFLGSKD